MTERLVLRPWQDADVAPFAALNADADVMRYFPAPLTRAESDDFVGRIRTHWAEHGFGLFALETREGAAFAGFVGLAVPGFEAAFTPCVEVGWRLAREYWGQGFAPEAARAAVAFGFEETGLEEIVSFTVAANTASRRVMEKLGMRRDAAEDFDHPALSADSPLRRHVLYRLCRARWEAAA